jgi:hypothetical protein
MSLAAGISRRSQAMPSSSSNFCRTTFFFRSTSSSPIASVEGVCILEVIGGPFASYATRRLTRQCRTLAYRPPYKVDFCYTIETARLRHRAVSLCGVREPGNGTGSVTVASDARRLNVGHPVHMVDPGQT